MAQTGTMKLMRASLNISLPEAMRTWVEEQVADGGYSTPSEFVRQLLRAEQERQVRGQIDRNLLKALDSGEATDLTSTDWEHIRQRVFAKKARRKK